jgi:hypothetical protein
VVAQQENDQQTSGGKASGEKKPSPEEKMQGRFPQPVRVGDLIGLPMLDWDDVTIGYVRHVVRTPAGKIQLITSYGGFLGWGERLVPVPIEVVAILARQLAALDMPRKEFDAAPTWQAAQTTPIPPDEMIRIAITRPGRRLSAARSQRRAVNLGLEADQQFSAAEVEHRALDHGRLRQH